MRSDAPVHIRGSTLPLLVSRQRFPNLIVCENHRYWC